MNRILYFGAALGFIVILSAAQPTAFARPGSTPTPAASTQATVPSGDAATVDAGRFMKCDGSTDDSRNLVAALDYLQSIGGGVLRLPKGKCLLSAAVTYSNNKKPFSIAGAGMTDTELVWSSDSEIDIGLHLHVLSDASISDLSLSGDIRKPTIGRAVVLCWGCRNVAFQRVKVSGGGWVAPKVGALRAGVYFYNCTNTSFDDGELTLNGGSGATQTNSTDFVVNWDGGDDSENISFRRNIIHGSNTAVSVSVYTTDKFDVSNNSIDQGNKIGPDLKVGGYGIMGYRQGTTKHSCGHGTITGNFVRNTAGTGIYLQGCPQSTVEENRLENVAQQQLDGTLAVAAVALSAGYPVQPRTGENFVRWNRISGSHANGISLANTDATVITGNILLNIAKSGVRLYNVESEAKITENLFRGVSECLLIKNDGRDFAFDGNKCERFRAFVVLSNPSLSSGSISGNEMKEGTVGENTSQNLFLANTTRFNFGANRVVPGAH